MKVHCNTCKKFLEHESNFGVARIGENGKVYRRGDCHGCHSENTNNKAKEKMLEAQPTRYYQCDECLFIWCTDSKRGPYANFKKFCPKCQTKVER